LRDTNLLSQDTLPQYPPYPAHPATVSDVAEYYYRLGFQKGVEMATRK